MEKIKAYIDSIKKEHLGFALSIQENNQTIFEDINGRANMEYDVDLTEDSVFYMASVAKEFTAYCVYLLIEEGVIKLEDKFVDTLHDFPDDMAEITIADLLYHTSGIADYLTILDYGDRSCSDYYAPEEIIDIICKSALQFNANDRYQYSNSNYFILALLIEKVTGQSLRAFSKERIFTPLSMASTFFNDDGFALIPRRASSYFIEDQDYKVQDYNFNLVGDGGLWSSLEDMKIWANHLLNDDLAVQMTEPRPLNTLKKNAYAFGLFRQEAYGQDVLWHDGAFGCYRSAIYLLPETKLSILVLVNNDCFNPISICKDIVELLKGKVEGQDRVQMIDKASLMKILGVYQNKAGALARVHKIEGVIYFDDMFEKKPLSSGHDQDLYGVYKDKNESICVYEDYIVRSIRGIEETYKRLEATPIDYLDYVGAYRCDDFKTIMRLSETQGRLKAKSYLSVDEHLEIVGKDLMRMGGAFLCFDRLSSGKINGFYLKTPRAVSTIFYKKMIGL